MKISIKKFLKIDILVTLLLIIFAIAILVQSQDDISNFIKNVKDTSTYFDLEVIIRFLAAILVFAVLYIAWLVYGSKTKKMKIKLFRTILVTLISLFINTLILSGFIAGCVILGYFPYSLAVFDLILVNLVVFFTALIIVQAEVMKSKIKLTNIFKSILLQKVFVFVPILLLFVSMAIFSPIVIFPLFVKFLIGIVFGFYCGIVVPILILNF